MVFATKTVVDLLSVVKFVAAGDAAGVEVADPREVLLDVAADVAIHDLHVVDVEEQFHAGRVDALAKRRCPRRRGRRSDRAGRVCAG